MSRHKVKSSVLKRGHSSRDTTPVIRIYCNGETERIYFEDLKNDLGLKSPFVMVISSERNRISLVKKVKLILRDEGFVIDDNHEVWVVFDVDALPDGQQPNPALIERQADDAVALCRKLKYKPIVSNDAFELWLLLHFEYYDSHLHRKCLLKKAEKQIPRYGKTISIYHGHLKVRTETALRNAGKLCATHGANLSRLSQCKPYSNAHELVLRLQELHSEDLKKQEEACTARN